MAIAPHAGGAAGTLTYFAAPLVGAKTVMLEEFVPEDALALIEKEKATAIGVVPTHLVRMLECDTSKYDLSSLRFIRSAGGYLSPQIAEEAEEAFGAVITSDLGTQDMGSVSGCRWGSGGGRSQAGITMRRPRVRTPITGVRRVRTVGRDIEQGAVEDPECPVPHRFEIRRRVERHDPELGHAGCHGAGTRRRPS